MVAQLFIKTNLLEDHNTKNKKATAALWLNTNSDYITFFCINEQFQLEGKVTCYLLTGRSIVQLS